MSALLLNRRNAVVAHLSYTLQNLQLKSVLFADQLAVNKDSKRLRSESGEKPRTFFLNANVMSLDGTLPPPARIQRDVSKGFQGDWRLFSSVPVFREHRPVNQFRENLTGVPSTSKVISTAVSRKRNSTIL